MPSQFPTASVLIYQMKKSLLPLTLLLWTTLHTQTVTLEEFSVGYNWLIGFETAPDDDRLYVFQKDGFIKICNEDGSVEPMPFLDISQKVNNSFNNEHGLLGVAFHPDYQANGYCFVFYNEINTGDVKVVRFQRSAANPNLLDPSTETDILSWPHPMANHVGGCMKFGPDGYLYIASGDGGGAGDPLGSGQNLMTFLGKILRIDVDNGLPYAIPPGNPFFGSNSILNEIWAYGLRNPWRFSFDKMTGDLWIGDVGQGDREEVDFQAFGSPGGANFGWSCREGTLVFNNDQCHPDSVYTDPLYEYENSLSTGNCSVTGGVVYRGTEYGDLFGKYIFTDFCSGRIWALGKDGDVVESVVEMGDFDNNDFTVLDENEKGELFVTGFFSNKIYKVVSENCEPVAFIEGPKTIFLEPGETAELSLFADAGFEFQWFQDGILISGATSQTLTVSQAATYTVVVTNPGNGCSATSNAITIAINNNPASIVGPLQVCEGSVYNYEATMFQNADYVWSVAGGMIANSNAPNEVGIQWLTPGIGQLEVQIALPNGEMESASILVNVQENDIVLSATGDFILCGGENNGHIDLEVSGTGPFEYIWSTGATTQDVVGLSPGVYFVIVTNNIGCSTEAEFLINVVPSVSYNIPDYFPCDSFVVLPPIVPDGMAICDFTWDVPNPDSVMSGTYSYTITDCSGCTYTGNIFINLSPPITYSFDITDPTPGQSDGSITVIASGGTPPYTFTWDNGDAGPTTSNLPAGEYTVLITDSLGCNQLAMVMIGDLLFIENMDGGTNMGIIPNPFQDNFELFFALKKPGDISISAMDISGKDMGVLLNKKYFSAGKYNFQYNVADWPNGTYLIVFEINGKKGFKKIIKK